MSEGYVRTVVLMGTVVTVHVVAHGRDSLERLECEHAVDRALHWFRTVEETCTRFDATSELRRLSNQIGVAVPVSPLVFEATQFALAVAEESGGAFDPTIGARMEARGFNREYRTGAIVHTPLDPDDRSTPPSFRDVRLDPAERTVTLLRPLVLDLGAVAKGLAIDLAANELRPFENFAIDAGGDLYLGGRNPKGDRWAVGIKHPRNPGELVATLLVSDVAVCTSGDYERRRPLEGDDAVDGDHHILDPRTGASPAGVASVTVVAPTALVADPLSTAAFVLGPQEGLRLLDRHNVDGLIVTADLDRFSSAGMRSYSELGTVQDA